MKQKTTVKDFMNTAQKLHPTIIDKFKDKDIVIEVTEYKFNRTLAQNNLLWAILGVASKYLGTTDKELYLDALKKYGKKIRLGCQVDDPELERMKKDSKYYDIIPSTKNENVVNFIKYFGSSGYNTSEMTVLIDGVISDCKEADIDVTYYDAELKSLLEAK